MIYCDKRLERYVRNKYYTELDSLTPEKRFVKKLSLMLDALSLEIHDEDQIFGWFVFSDELRDKTPFSDEAASASDIQNMTENRILLF